jgi:hypothetical protein
MRCLRTNPYHQRKATPSARRSKPLTPAMMPMLVTDLIIHDTLEGSGRGRKTGQALSVHYRLVGHDATKPGGKG